MLKGSIIQGFPSNIRNSPNNSSEKKMIEGFLVGKGRIKQDMLEEKSQTKLV